MKLKRIVMGRSVSLAFCHRLNPSKQSWMLDLNEWGFLVRTQWTIKRDAEMNKFKHEEEVYCLLSFHSNLSPVPVKQ
jgi:hypothetical protein